jgi:hypothetical protein
MKPLPVLFAVTFAACARSSLTDQLTRASWVDLTYPFDSTTIRRGWGSRWPDRARYLGTAKFAADIPAFENVAHLSAVPATGAFVIALPKEDPRRQRGTAAHRRGAGGWSARDYVPLSRRISTP